jgi:hypothetical protein
MLHVDDDGFVRAPAPLVYRRLTDVGSWPRWWRGCTVRPLPDPDGAETWAVTWRRDPVRGLRMGMQPHHYRHEHGFKLSITGDVAGEAEFWLEPTAGGTVVHHLLIATTTGRPVPTLVTYRAVLRRGLWGLKDGLQTEVRTAIGLHP